MAELALHAYVAPNWLFLLPGGLLMLVGMALVFWLPRAATLECACRFGHPLDDISSDLRAARRAILSIGFFAKVFSYAERFDRILFSGARAAPREYRTRFVLGIALRLAGFVGDLRVAAHWASVISVPA